MMQLKIKLIQRSHIASRWTAFLYNCTKRWSHCHHKSYNHYDTTLETNRHARQSKSPGVQYHCMLPDSGFELE